jgi:AcrR family transcriptional regulator
MQRRPRHPPEQTRKEILAAAEAQFQLYGYARMNMQGLAKSIGMSPATVHKYFHSKQGLAEAVCGIMLSRYVAYIESRMVMDEGTEVAFDRFAIAILEYNSSNTYLTPEIFELYVSAAQQDWVVFREFRAQVVKLLREVLEEGVRRNDVRPSAVADVEQVFDSFASIMHPLLVRDFPQEATVRAHRLARLIFQAVRTNGCPPSEKAAPPGSCAALSSG